MTNRGLRDRLISVRPGPRDRGAKVRLKRSAGTAPARARRGILLGYAPAGTFAALALSFRKTSSASEPEHQAKGVSQRFSPKQANPASASLRDTTWSVEPSVQNSRIAARSLEHPDSH